MIKLIPLLLMSSMAMATPPWYAPSHSNSDQTVNIDGPNNRNINSNDSTANTTVTTAGGNGGAGGKSDSSVSVGDINSRGGAGGSGSADNQVETIVDVAGSDNQINNESKAVNTSTVNDGDTSVKTGDTTLKGGDVNIVREYEAAANAVNLNLAHCSDGAGASSKSGSISTGGVNYICEASRAMGLILTTIPRETPEEVEKTLEKAKDIKDDAYDYMKIRKFTAAIGAAFRDVWPILGLLLLI